MVTKQEVIQLMSRFKENLKGQYYLLIPTIIMTASTIEAAYSQIGRNSSDCKYFYDGIAYREDLYDILISFGISCDDAYRIMQNVRKGIAEMINFDGFSISPALKDWCLGVQYLPSREIVIDALKERINQIEYNDADFREALLETLPEYKYTPMTFIGTIKELQRIKKKIFELKKSKNFLIKENEDFSFMDYDIDYKTVRILTLTTHSLCNLPRGEIIYTSLCDMITSGIPIVALIEVDCYYTLEERLKALLQQGVVCEM